MKRSKSAVIALLSIMALAMFAYGQSEVPRELKGGILNGKATSLPKPEYSAEAKAAKLEGTVKINVLIDEEGNVISAEPVPDEPSAAKSGDGTIKTEEPVSPVLLESAQRAAMAARFSPTLINNSPVKVRGIIIYRFMAGGEVAAVRGGVLNSKATSLPAPVYPPAAKAVRASGAVSVEITFDEKGDVIYANAVSGHPLLRAAAVEAAKAAKFSPTQLNGNPIKVSGVIVYNFAADEGSN